MIQTFTFKREKLVTTTITTTKEVQHLGTKAEQSETALNLVVSPSNRPLANILSLSHPNELSRYDIKDSRPGWGKGVTYSRSDSEDTETNLLRQVEEANEAKEALRKAELETAELKEALEIWQVSNLVAHALGIFVWKQISDVDKEELRKYKMINFLDMYHLKWSKKPELAPGRNVARRIYNKLDVSLKHLAAYIMHAKSSASTRRGPLAHPAISNARVEEYLREFGDGDSGLDTMEIAAFCYIKATANTEANIQATGHGYYSRCD